MLIIGGSLPVRKPQHSLAVFQPFQKYFCTPYEMLTVDEQCSLG